MDEPQATDSSSLLDWARARWSIVEPLPPENPKATPTTAAAVRAANATVSPSHEEGGYFVLAGLDTASKWAAGGFSAVVAVLLFFGIKDGVLDQALRLYPIPTLCVFILLGVGVLTSLFAGAIRRTARMRLWALIVALAVMVGLAALFLPNVDVLASDENQAGTPGWLRALWWLWRVVALAGVAFLILLFVERMFTTEGRRTARMRLWALIVALAVMVVLATFLLPHIDALANDENQGETPDWARAVLWLSGVVALAGVAFVVLLFVERISTTVGGWRTGYCLGLFAFVVILIGVAFATISLRRGLAIAIAFIFLVATAWSFAKEKAALPIVAGIIIIGVAATSLGLYGAAKLSVRAKMLPVEPQVSATLEPTDGRTTLKIVAAAARVRGERLLVTVSAEPRLIRFDTPGRLEGTELDIWHSVLEPNGLDEIDATVSVPLVLTRWKSIAVRHCTIGDGDSTERCPESDGLDVLNLRNPTSGDRVEVTGHIVAKSSSTLQVTLTGRDLASGEQLQAEVCRVRKVHTSQLTHATLTPDAMGALTWSADVPAGRDGDVLVLQYRECPIGSDCKADPMTPLARYTLP